jgi:hypothetical protein
VVVDPVGARGYIESRAVRRWDEGLDDEASGALVAAQGGRRPGPPVACRRVVRRALGRSRMTEAEVGDVRSVLARSVAPRAVLGAARVPHGVAPHPDQRAPQDPTRPAVALRPTGPTT